MIKISTLNAFDIIKILLNNGNLGLKRSKYDNQLLFANSLT